MTPIFPMGLIEQEMSPERWIPIPEEVLEVLSLWRPTAHPRAPSRQALDTPARIFYKYEGVSPRRQPQAQHICSAGLLQQARGV
jgi:tryptophan synthase beta chain